MKKEQITELGKIFNKLATFFSDNEEKDKETSTKLKDDEEKDKEKPKEDEKKEETKQEFKTSNIKDSEKVVEYDSLEVGKVLKDENGETMADGEYIIDVSEADQEKKYKKVVIKDGLIDSVEDFEETKDDIPVEDDVKMAKESVLTEIVKILKINLKDDGSYYLDFSVCDGAIQWGNLSSTSWKTLMSEQEDTKNKEIKKLKDEKEAEKQKFSSEINDLKEKIKVLGEDSNNKEPYKQEFSKEKTMSGNTGISYMYIPQ